MNPNTSEPITAPSTDEIREILAKRIDQQKQAVGIVVGVIRPNGRRVVAYGKLANGDPRTLDGDTIFEIGSISKVFTSLLLAEMVNRKEVALDDPAAKYLPEHVRMPQRSGKSITLLDLSTHSSGLPPVPSNLKLNLAQGEMKDAANPHAFYSMDDLYEFLSGYTLPRDPGSEFEYSNLGAGLLGHILAYRAGTDYESLIRSRITQPLGMPDTGITLSPSMKQRMATGHNALLAPVDQKDWDPSHAFAGAGALRSSVNDMLTFLEAFLGYKESPLAPAMKAMLEVRRPLGKTKFEIGLAWQIFGETAWHGGGTGGFRSFVAYNPKESIGVVVLSNASTPSGVDDIGLHLLNPKLPLANAEPPKSHTVIQLDPKLLDNYTGRYQLPDRIFEITRDGGRLFAQGFGQQGMGGPMFEMFAESEKNFFVKETGSQFTFETDPEGRATGLIMYRVGRPGTPGTRLS
jgi:D-alanyl-D-alanine-carboxypeptidase/D-alanyl-D-alanine-endopeptidase